MTNSAALFNIPASRPFGRVCSMRDSLIEVENLQLPVGAFCQIHGEQNIYARVIGFTRNILQVMSFEPALVRVGQRVYPVEHETGLVKTEFEHSVLNALGQSLMHSQHQLPKLPNILQAKNIFERSSVHTPQLTGNSFIDHLFPLARGQKIGVFAPAGVGKTTLLQQLIKQVNADLKIMVLLGERGREAQEYITSMRHVENTLVIIATADESALMRQQAIYTAFAFAEQAMSQGKHVFITVDSMTRFAMAQREIGLAIGEPPTARGYTPSVFTKLAQLTERCGQFKTGSLTGVFSILVEGELNHDPIAMAMQALLDGHIVLDRHLADRGIYPAINILQSLSRLTPILFDSQQLQLARAVQQIVALMDRYQDMISIGAYQTGQNPKLDFAIEHYDELLQKFTDNSDDMVQYLQQLMMGWNNVCHA